MHKFGITISDNAKPVEPVLLVGNYTKIIKKAAEFGYDAVEIHVNKPLEVPYEDILSACEKTNTEVAAMATGGSYVNEKLSFIDDNSEIRKKSIQRFKEYIDLGDHLNCKIFIGLMRGVIGDFEKYPIYYNRLKSALEEILNYAENKKVRLIIEAINRFQTNHINSLYDTIELIQNFKKNAIGLHIDTFHMNIEEKNLIKTIKDCSDYIEYVHYSDSNRLIPGAGNIDFLSITRCLNDIEYKGVITLECLPIPTQEQAAENGINYLRALDNLVSIEKIIVS